MFLFRRKRRILVVNVLEKSKIGLDIFYIIERSYLSTMQTEYLVCKNYDKKSNTYQEGNIFKSSIVAYEYFNACVNAKKIIEIVNESTNGVN